MSIEDLATAAPDDRSRGALTKLEEPERSLQAALDALGMTSAAPGPGDIDEVTARAMRLHSATTIAKATTATLSVHTARP